MTCSFPERHGGVRTLKKQVLFHPYEEPVPRSDDDPCDFDPHLADLLPELDRRHGARPSFPRTVRVGDGRARSERVWYVRVAPECCPPASFMLAVGASGGFAISPLRRMRSKVRHATPGARTTKYQRRSRALHQTSSWAGPTHKHISASGARRRRCPQSGRHNRKWWRWCGWKNLRWRPKRWLNCSPKCSASKIGNFK
jgi:hydroxyacyl-ACP dehydratase HTD2-like protein with hotdog domain